MRLLSFFRISRAKEEKKTNPSSSFWIMLRTNVIRRNLGRGDEYVKSVFSSVAGSYDLMNDVASMGVHRYWKDYYVSQCVRPEPGKKYLDVAGGTGDIAFRIADALKSKGRVTKVPNAVASATFPSSSQYNNIHADAAVESAQEKDAAGKEEGASSVLTPVADVVVFDLNAAMLNEGKARAIANGHADCLEWVEGNAEVLPFPDDFFHSYTIAFGIRNVSNRLNALREAKRVLRNGGVLNVLEFSKVNCPLLSVPYSVYSQVVIPNAGYAIAGDRESYQYLIDSIREFPDQECFAGMISGAGFDYVRYQDLSMGIVAIHTAVKVK